MAIESIQKLFRRFGYLPLVAIYEGIQDYVSPYLACYWPDLNRALMPDRKNIGPEQSRLPKIVREKLQV